MKSLLIKKPDLEGLILAFRRKIMDACRKEGMTYELTFSQMEIMSFVGLEGTKTMKEIATHLNIAPPSATGFVRELENKGLVERITSSTDRRIVAIGYTAKARKQFATIKERKQTILSKMLSRLEERDKKTLERIISILIK
jgi:DNA-binding MarR family transcriptional regulator